MNTPDRTKEAREFYAQRWGSVLSDNSNDYNGKTGKYGGETIITFRTMSGFFIRASSLFKGTYKMPDSICARLNDIKTCEEITSADIERFEKFMQCYTSFANFMPLITTNPSASLNMIKGRAPYHDFPDLFYTDLRNKKPAHIFENTDNANYFKRFDNWNWQVFVKDNFLQPFFEDDGEFTVWKKLSPPSDLIMPYNKNIAKRLDDTQRLACRDYICKTFLPMAIEIIEARAALLT